MSKNKNKYLEEQDGPALFASGVEVVSTLPPEKPENTGKTHSMGDLAIGYCKVARQDGDRTVYDWKVVAIPFDGGSLIPGMPEVLENLETEAEAVDRFKINVAEKLMLRYRR